VEPYSAESDLRAVVVEPCFAESNLLGVVVEPYSAESDLRAVVVELCPAGLRDQTGLAQSGILGLLLHRGALRA